MIDLFKIATIELAKFLDDNLPGLSKNWWQKNVIDRLSFQQQRMVQERGYSTLRQLDLAALLRVLDQNWYELSSKLHLSREARSWVKELQLARNRWAHPSSEPVPPSESYRDADTLGRLLEALGADEKSLTVVESAKAGAMAAMTRNVGNADDIAGKQQNVKMSRAISTRKSSNTLQGALPLHGDQALGDASFHIKLGVAYYRHGIINPGVKASVLLGEHDEQITIVFGDKAEPLVSRIDRFANRNGSVRIVGKNRQIANWFQRHFNEGEIVEARVQNPNSILLLHKPWRQ